MPKSEESVSEFKSLQELAMKMDADPDFEPAEATKAPESRPEPVQEEKVETTEPMEETPEVEAADTAEIEPDKPEPGDSDKIRKDKERLARNWQEMQKRNEEAKSKVAAAEERARKAEEEAAKLRAKPAEIPVKDRRGYTVEDYENYAAKSEEEGNYQQAKNAREEAQILRQQIFEDKFKSEWQANVAQMVEAHPDLANPTTALNKEVEKLLREPDNIYITRSSGIKSAVAQARANLEAGSISAMQAENEKLKQELNRLEKLGSIPGRDGAMKRTGQKGFEDMTLEQQRAQLLRQSEELDAESMRY